MTSPDARSSRSVRTLWPCSEASASASPRPASPRPASPRPASPGPAPGLAPAFAQGDGAGTPGLSSINVSPVDPTARRADAASEVPNTPIEAGGPVTAAELLNTVPAHLETLPGLSQRQRASYPRWATLYLRQLSWQDRLPSAEGIETFIDRLKQRGVDESKRLMAQEALIFLHDVVLGIPSVVQKPEGAEMSEELTGAVQKAVVAQLSGPPRLMARLAFATGMTPREAAYIRTGDITLGQNKEGPAGTIVVRDESGRCDRIVEIDADLADALRVQLLHVRSQYDQDREERFAGAPLPPQIEAVFPEAGNGWEWQFVFPSEQREVNEETGEEIRPCMGADHFIATIEAILKAETHVIKLED